ncbi:MAG: hypothetical protein ACRDUS_04520 [Mycobacterium sp.]
MNTASSVSPTTHWCDITDLPPDLVTQLERAEKLTSDPDPDPYASDYWSDDEWVDICAMQEVRRLVSHGPPARLAVFKKPGTNGVRVVVDGDWLAFKPATGARNERGCSTSSDYLNPWGFSLLEHQRVRDQVTWPVAFALVSWGEDPANAANPIASPAAFVPAPNQLLQLRGERIAATR